MRSFLQTTFSILSAISVTVAIFLGIYVDLIAALFGVLATLIFLGLTLLVKYGNPFRRPGAEPHTDFMNSDEENEAIRKQLADKENSEK